MVFKRCAVSSHLTQISKTYQHHQNYKTTLLLQWIIMQLSWVHLSFLLLYLLYIPTSCVHSLVPCFHLHVNIPILYPVCIMLLFLLSYTVTFLFVQRLKLHMLRCSKEIMYVILSESHHIWKSIGSVGVTMLTFTNAANNNEIIISFLLISFRTTINEMCTKLNVVKVIESLQSPY